MGDTKKSKYLQIGPSNLCTKFYELAIDISETGNLCSIVSPNEIGTPLKIQFHIMGMSLMTKEFYGFKGIINKEKFKVQLKSEIQFLAAYFKQFPSLTFYLTCGEKLIGSSIMDLHDLTDLREHFTASAKEKIILKSTDGKDSHVTDYLNPFLKVEITLIPVLSVPEGGDFEVATPAVSVPTSSTSNVLAPLQPANIFPSFEDQTSIVMEESTYNLEEPVISCGLIPEIQVPSESEKPPVENNLPPCVGEESSFQNPPDFITFQNESEFKTEGVHHDQLTQTEEINLISENAKNVDSRQPHSSIVYYNNPLPTGFPVLSTSETLPKAYVEDLATKYIEELEDWKEKQQEMFKFELKRKADKHLSKLSLEWAKRQQSLENNFAERLENCQSLKTRLEEVLIELELKIEKLNKFEEELQFGKNELDKRYTIKFRELRKASKQHQTDMEEKIKRCELQKTELKNKIKDYDAEIARLNRLLESESEMRLTLEESKRMLAEKEELVQKLEKALESKNYFKNQCLLAVREIHKLKEEKEDNQRWQIKKDKESMEIIGLVEEINSEVDEMRKDQSTLKTLRNEIINYGNA